MAKWLEGIPRQRPGGWPGPRRLAVHTYRWGRHLRIDLYKTEPLRLGPDPAQGQYEARVHEWESEFWIGNELIETSAFGGLDVPAEVIRESALVAAARHLKMMVAGLEVAAGTRPKKTPKKGGG